jgi:pyridoxine 5-phosphate synthase
MAATAEMLKIACEVKPNACCLVPEKREELTTEGGLDVASNIAAFKNFVLSLKDNNIRVSLFIDPDIKQIDAAAEIGADIIELHTGKYAVTENQRLRIQELDRIKTAAQYAHERAIEVHAGHGLTYDNVLNIAIIPELVELNIGHFLIAEAVYVGLGQATINMVNIINKVRSNGNN